MQLKWKPGDILLIIFIIGIFILAKVYPQMATRQGNKNYYIIEVNGRQIDKRILSTTDSYRKVIPLADTQAVLEVDRGRVRISPHRKICPDGICSAIGWIKNSGETIVCVPNKLMIKIIKEDQDYDFVLK